MQTFPLIALLGVILVACVSSSPTPGNQILSLDCPDSAEPQTPVDRMIRVAPRYPRRAFQEGIEGYVRMEFEIDPEGRPINIRLTQDRPEGYGFGRAAVAAVRDWRYCPYSPSDPDALTPAEIAIPFKMGRGPRRITSP